MEIAKLQYITQFSNKKDILLEVEKYLSAGGRWVQLRMKNVSENEIIGVAKEVRKLCTAKNAVFLINDNPQIALETEADGVHLGKSDTTTEEARKILGNDKIIGRTAHSFEDILDIARQKVDYIGLGALRKTQTKDNIAGVLGYEGYKHIFSKIDFKCPPIVAIGGVTSNDITTLLSIGLHGVAVSGIISRSENPEKITQLFIKTIKESII
ncbi:MAG: thiamine phosphate synthase [Bacteroidetes bacterium]|nr:thiamine phosphate synthase [Bacteroidota bacterium]